MVVDVEWCRSGMRVGGRLKCGWVVMWRMVWKYGVDGNGVGRWEGISEGGEV